MTLVPGYSIALFNKLSSKECWNSMHVHVLSISGPEWGKFLLFSHSVNSYRASVCQALGVFLFFFLLLLFPVLFSWTFSDISPNVCEDTWKSVRQYIKPAECKALSGPSEHCPHPWEGKPGKGWKNQDARENLWGMIFLTTLTCLVTHLFTHWTLTESIC